jgi:hypothetical protein
MERLIATELGESSFADCHEPGDSVLPENGLKYAAVIT